MGLVSRLRYAIPAWIVVLSAVSKVVAENAAEIAALKERYERLEQQEAYQNQRIANNNEKLRETTIQLWDCCLVS